MSERIFKTLIEKRYHKWESMQDFHRDIDEAVEDLPIEFDGTIYVRLMYVGEPTAKAIIQDLLDENVTLPSEKKAIVQKMLNNM